MVWVVELGKVGRAGWAERVGQSGLGRAGWADQVGSITSHQSRLEKKLCPGGSLTERTHVRLAKQGCLTRYLK
jgi:hypothetical protein